VNRLDYNRMLQIIATMGLNRLREHIRTHGPEGLPAVLATFGLAEAARQGSSGGALLEE
jgi:hypothetical protein